MRSILHPNSPSLVFVQGLGNTCDSLSIAAAPQKEQTLQCNAMQKPFAVDQEDKNRDQYVISSEQKKEVKVLLMTFDSFMKETTSLPTLKTNKTSYQPRGVTQANFHPTILELKKEET